MHLILILWHQMMIWGQCSCSISGFASLISLFIFQPWKRTGKWSDGSWVGIRKMKRNVMEMSFFSGGKPRTRNQGHSRGRLPTPGDQTNYNTTTLRRNLLSSSLSHKFLCTLLMHGSLSPANVGKSLQQGGVLFKCKEIGFFSVSLQK